MRVAIICFLLCGCAASTADIDERSAYVARAARNSVDVALRALKNGDEKTFKSLLSEERTAAYKREFFQEWSDKVNKYATWSMGQYEPGRHLIEGTVTVVLKIDRQGDFVSVRIRFENGAWKWHQQ